MKHILRSTFRNFVRRPSINLINLLGLAIGLAVVIILVGYTYSEFTTDSFHKNRDRIYLYGKHYTPGVLKDQIDLGVPGVEATVRIGGTWEAPVFQVSDHEPVTSDILFVDRDFFKLFTYKAVEGNLTSVLDDPLTAVITESLAQKLFGNEPAVGKTITYNNGKELTVAAVIGEARGNSSLSFSAVTSMETRKIIQPDESEFTEWEYYNFETFILLQEGIQPDEAEKNILSVIPGDNKKSFEGTKLMPLKEIYFSGIELYDNYLRSGDRKKDLILAMVAALVLITALVNFINISSSQWREKIRQTGVMKVIGARRSEIFRIILSESALLFFMALIWGLVLTKAVLPLVCNYTGTRFDGHLIFSPAFLAVFVAVTFVLSIVFSLVPAYRISSSKAVSNLGKRIESQSKNSFSRGMLVSVQFTIAIALIAFTVLVQKQVDFGSSNLGFNQENIIGINLTQQLYKKKDVLKQLLQEKPVVGNISFTQYYPGKNISSWGTGADLKGEKKHLQFDTFSADGAFAVMMGLRTVTGRFYSDSLASDDKKVVINETFVREYQLDRPIGITFSAGAGRNYEIIGVVKDFHYKAVNEPIAPLAIRNDPYASYCLVKLQTGDFNSLHRTIREIKAAASDLSPSFPVEIGFLDQAVENMYQSELRFRRAFSLFAGCAVVLCCMGILAMSLFACRHRTKEIGIRKVHGAKVAEILAMLNKDFVKWVVIAFLIATPVAWYAMDKWLENFAYKTELSWWIFALAGLLALGIALLTVSWQSWKAAIRNPVEALRYE